MEENESRPTEQFYTPSSSTPPRRRSKGPILAIFTVLVISILGFAAYNFLGLGGSGADKVTPTPTTDFSSFAVPTDTPTPSSDEDVTPTKEDDEDSTTPTKAPTTSPKPSGSAVDKTTGLDKSKLKVEVLNGSGTAGAAGKAADILKSAGYNVVSTGNADNYDYTDTVIEIKAASDDYLPLLKKDLSGTYTIDSSAKTLSADSSADARVIVGK